MRELVFVRGLWGKDTLSHQKAVWDFRNRMPGYSALLDRSQTIGVAFGSHNAEVLKSLGMEEICVEEKLPVAYENSKKSIDDSLGRIQGGISTWWHKLEAISVALEFAKSVVWLDCDVITRKSPDAELFNILASGPAIQGCNAAYVQRGKYIWKEGVQPPPDSIFFNGGCYYFRDRIIDEVIMLHASQNGSDERAVTDIAKTLGAAVHNPLLFTACNQVPRGTDSGYFRQGTHMRVQHFADAIAGKRNWPRWYRGNS